MARRSSNFNKLSRKLGRRKGVRNPRALAAYIGRKKYGKAGMARKSAAGRKRAASRTSRTRKRRTTRSRARRRSRR